MAVLGLLGDMMLGRGVGEALQRDGPAALFSREVEQVLAEADAVVANLECCISARGRRWPDPEKPFFFRAPPVAVEALHRLGVTAVTLANNHALDYGYEALLDSLDLLREAGIATAGAGADERAARRPARILANGVSIDVVGCTDHPAEYGAATGRPGTAYTPLQDGLDAWLADAIHNSTADCILVTPHWGPNMVAAPIPRVRHAAAALITAGATLVAGHSAHVFHGVAGRVLFDLGDVVDDYVTHPDLRNDLGLVFLVELDASGPRAVVAVPIALDFCHTRLASGDDAEWVRSRFTSACAALGTKVCTRDGRMVVDLRSAS